MSFPVIRVNWFPGQHTGNAGVLIAWVLIKYSTPFLQKMELELIVTKSPCSSFLQQGRMHKHNHQNVHAPTSLQQLSDPSAEQCLPIVSWFRHRLWAQKGLYPDSDLRENKALLKAGILLQTALYVTETLKQIRLCTDGRTAPIINCGTRAWDDNHLLFIKDCVFCKDPSIPQGAK